MTSISLSDVVKNMQLTSSAGISNASQTAGKNFQAGERFQNAMDLCKKAELAEPEDLQSNSCTKSTEEKPCYTENGSVKEKVRAMKAQNPEKEEMLTEEELEVVEEAANAIISQIAKELGVSEEDIEMALENLGIHVLELGNTNQMSALFVEVLDLTDNMQIITDEKLFASLTQLTQGVDDVIQSLQKELQVPTDVLLQQFEMPELENVMREAVQSETLANESVETDVEMVISTETKVENDVDEILQQNVDTLVGRSLREEENAKSETVIVGDDAGVSEGYGTVDDIQNTELSQQKETSNFKNKGSESEEHKPAMNQNTFSLTTEGQQVNALEHIETSGISYTTVDDIMEQIGDYVKTNVTADVKQMEIQLTPANLGQVHINIASKNGVITAQITAENETVKNAIELQVVQLKERLEGQGVKIEAVEVTVASHEFERNLDENNQNRNAEEETKKSSSKKWNLSELDDELLEGESLSAAEQVELDMMKIKGNQLNYMV